MPSPTLRGQQVRTFQNHDNTRIDHVLDIGLFTPELLKTEQGLHNALTAMDRSWWQDELEPLELTVRELMAGPLNLLPYTVAIVLDEARYHRLLFTLQHTFPRTAGTFVSSLASDLMNHLRDFYIRILSPDVPRSLDDCHRAVVLAFKVLSALNDIKFNSEEVPLRPSNDKDIVASKHSQRRNKHAKRQSNSTTDLKSFSDIGRDVPRNREEAANLAQQILDNQKSILEEYLRVLRLPGLLSIVEDIYMSSRISNIVRPVVPEPASKGLNRPTRDASLVPDIPPAYPQIQPLKAAKYFSEPADGFGYWNLLLSSRAIQHLKGFHRDKEQWRLIKKKMQDLSNGFFSDSNQKKLKGGDHGVPIYEAKVTRDLRIIYQIDLAPHDATGNDHQIIKIWGIHTHAQMDNRLWVSISYHQSKIGGEYRLRCLHRETPKRPGNNVILPASWPNVVEKLPVGDLSGDYDISMSNEEQLELHSILALEKFTRVSQALMNSIMTGNDDTYAFELAGPERQICDHPSSCIVLGRSGTGKTTTMVFKMIAREMLNIEQAAEADGTPTPKYRQLFVTQSRILARRVQEYFGKMLLSQSAGNKTSQEIEHLALRNQRALGEDDMLDMHEDEEDERSDLPKKFSELEDQHFPLFLTVGQLSKLLESDCNLSFKRRPRTQEHRRAEKQSQSVVEDDMSMLDEDLAKDDSIVNVPTSTESVTEKESIITFETFFYTYWPHFPQSLTKGLGMHIICSRELNNGDVSDPALVWNEFMGVIKGSEESLDPGCDSNFLDKTAYLNLSHRMRSTFAKQRETIYGIFESYVKLKGQRGDYDAADRTHAILRTLSDGLPGGRKVDFLYVDEVQDNLIVDARLLRHLCGNPHGMFWAGDTAQTISMGSSFRFNDLKAFLYRLEKQSCGLRSPVHPAPFQLAINYRSHAGVVNCAHSIIELITQFWPDSIDTLARERGVVDGPRPVFFCGWDSKVTRYEQFLFHESGNIEFGAQQCIIVRDEKAREDLRREIGDVGLIMTIYECKGLEFNDVLLFNFFADSTASAAEWRVILNAIEESKRSNLGVPRFDECKHSSMCSELKSLYVGITRARCHVWILDIQDRGEDKGEPMRVFWESKNLVQICRSGDPVPELAVRSTPEQWSQQGRALFKTKHYQLAIFCFERAGLLLERWISQAYLLRRTAHRIALSGQGAHRKAAYLRAAEAFVICGQLSSSLVERSKYLFSLGGDCFVDAGAHASAAQAFLGSESFTKAAQQFKIAKLYEEAADVVLLHRRSVDSIVANQCLSIAKLHFCKEHQFKKAARLFKSIDEQLSYLEEYGFNSVRISVLEDLCRWNDAAEIHYEEGRYLDAISLWIRVGDPESRQRAAVGLLDSLWKTLPLGTRPDKTQSFQTKLLDLLHTLGAELLDETQRDESAMFLAIFADDLPRLLRLARDFHHGARRNPIVALVCYDHALTKPHRVHNESAQTVTKYLEDYDSYSQLMRQVIVDSEKIQVGQWSTGGTSKLLGFTETHDGSGAPPEINVLPTSILYEFLTDDTSKSHEDTITITPYSLPQVIHQALGIRLRDRLLQENDVCIHAKAFRQWCLNFVVSGSCGRVECPRVHISPQSLDAEAFNLLTRLHMQQISIVHNMYILSDHRERRWLQRIWQERIYDTLYPAFYALGHISILGIISHHPSSQFPARLRNSSIPENQCAIRVLSDWIYDRFYSLKPYRDGLEDRFLTDVVQTAQLAFALDRVNAHNIWKAECIVSYRPPHLQRNGGYILHDLLTFLEGSSGNSVPSGVVFIKHILEKRIPIDVSTLLNILEDVVARAIMGYHRSLHHITLPRSWIVNTLSNWNEGCRIRDISIFCHILDPLAELLEGIYSNSGVDYLTYERRPLSIPLRITVRNVLIFRICRCIALLGYNVSNGDFKERIRRTLSSSSWKKPGRNFSPMIYQYVTADHWSILARAVRLSTQSPLDELVFLCKRESSPSTYHFRMPRLLLFDSEDEVLPALEYVTSSKFNPEAKPFVPSVLIQESVPLPETELLEDDTIADDSFGYETGAVEVVPPNDLSVQRTEAEIEAASIIQVWYRRRVVAKSPSNSEAAMTRSLLHVKCRAETINLPAQVSLKYRCMFLGPLPHVLAALHGCGKATQATKKIYVKKLLPCNHGEALNLDEVHEMITKCIDLYKTHKRLWKDLEPCSMLHHKGCITILKERVGEVNVLVKETLAMTPSMEDFLWDMEVGYKGIVREPPPPPHSPPTAKFPKRPTLNTDDTDF